jgi:FlaA1/EpsC-like NDP-sugar epimerase
MSVTPPSVREDARQLPPPAELLLGRPEVGGDIAQATTALAAGRRVLVTGAAGSVGWPLAQALACAEPEALVLLDHHEYSLFSLERALGAGGGLIFELIDVRDRARLRRAFERYRPQVVLHLAAAKHVPYGERFPEGAVASNVLATADLLDLAAAAGVQTLVYPSSDKSVDPPSLYGATKRLGEALVQARAQFVVRFVNIVGTRGSVIETFTHQVLADWPLTVTDERMTRYWISMDEAIWSLVAASAGEAGQVVMPDCGAAVPLLETARRLAGWYRPEREPYPIACTGIRPGERLHEVLLSDNEQFAAASRPGLRYVRSRRDPARLAALPDVLAELRGLVDAGERARLREVCLNAARELQ